MSSKRAIRRRSCKGKKRYDTEEDAIHAAGRVRVRLNSGQIRAYPCRFCGGWHIGHTPKRIAQAIKAAQERKCA